MARRNTVHRLIGGGLVTAAAVWAIVIWTAHFRSLTLHRDAAEALDQQDHVLLTRLTEQGLELDRPITIAEGPAARHTLLTLAAEQGRLDSVEHLLSLGASPAQRDASGRTALLLAASSNNAELTRLLLDHGVDPGNVGQRRTALTAAAKNGAADVVVILLEHGADVNEVDERGTSPLLAACPSKADLRTFQLLLDAGGRVNYSAGSRTPLLLAAQGFIGEGRETQTAKVAALVAAGADVNAKDHRGRTALFLAAEESAEATQILLEAGASPEVTDVFGMSVLHVAASDGDDRTVALLIEAGADPARGRGMRLGDSTPLDYAKGRSDAEGRKIATRLQAEADARNEDATTPDP